MLPGASGLRWMPRKIASIAMITMDPSIVAIVMLSVVLDRAIHLYLPGCRSAACSCAGSRRDITPTLSQPTPKRLLAGNYLTRADRNRPGATTHRGADDDADID